ncbi:response regulator [Reyranella sp.]|uniref:response regulator n=1 Tax=Reyranella sp. TaxID=1929291 RepID=UPI0037842E3F
MSLLDSTVDKPHVLVVDDDTRLRGLLNTFLSKSGFRVTTASNAAEARQRLSALDFDLIVLDVMMPGESGLEFAGELRRSDDVPILMLTAMGEPKDRIAGLEQGVDDYLGKPFDPRELLLRIQNILRRNKPQAPANAETPRQVSFGPFQFDLEVGELAQDGKRVALTETETALLRALAARLGEAVSREALCRIVGSAVNERAIDVQVTRLRRKIEPDPSFPRYLRTVRGQGYRLVDA